jgi:hypothetical protein
MNAIEVENIRKVYRSKSGENVKQLRRGTDVFGSVGRREYPNDRIRSFRYRAERHIGTEAERAGDLNVAIHKQNVAFGNLVTGSRFNLRENRFAPRANATPLASRAYSNARHRPLEPGYFNAASFGYSSCQRSSPIIVGSLAIASSYPGSR